MIIDIHTHVFPDKIAEAVLANSEVDLELSAKAPGTERGLRDYMEESRTDLSIVLAVAAEPRLVKKTNDWLLSIRDDRIQFFGAIHPDLEGWQQELMRLKGEGVKGIKFNALMQKIRPDDVKLFPIYEKILEEDMVVMIHAGSSYKERNEPGKILATPERIAKVLDSFPDLKVIAAHFGGNNVLEQMKEHLLGREIYLDTSYPPDVHSLNPDETLSIIRKHGADRILFGTDYPWETQIRSIDYICSLGLTEEEEEAILGENARKLLFDN